LQVARPPIHHSNIGIKEIPISNRLDFPPYLLVVFLFFSRKKVKQEIQRQFINGISIAAGEKQPG
jgi:hypothetical protein